MIHIIEKKFKGLVDWIHYWRNLPGKLELTRFEVGRLKTELDKSTSLTSQLKLDVNSLLIELEDAKKESNIPSLLDAEYWNNKWQQRKVFYKAPIRISVCDYLKYKQSKELTAIADYIIENNNITAEKVDNIPLFVLTWIEHMFKDKVFKYVIDKSEDWQSPSNTLKRALGDCDDWGILEYNIIREILKMIYQWDNHKHRLKCVAGNVNRYGTIPSSAGGHFYLIWLHKDCKWYTVESTYHRAKSIRDFAVRPMKINPVYGTIWFTFNEELSWAQNSITVSKEDFKKI